MGCNCGQKYRPSARRANPRAQVVPRRTRNRSRMKESKKQPTVVPQQDAGIETKDPRGPRLAATGQLVSVVFGGEGGPENVLCPEEKTPTKDPNEAK